MEQISALEHRLARRSDLHVDTLVELNGGSATPGIIRNVSLTGIYVEILREHRAGVHGTICLKFALPGTPGGGVAQWRGFVVRSDERGIAAIFDSDHEEDWDGLAELLGSVDRWPSHDRHFLRMCLDHLIGD